MKITKYLTALAIAGILTVTTHGEERKHSIKLNPLGIAFGTYNLEYELKVADKISVSLAGLYTHRKINPLTAKGMGGALKTSFYLTGDAITSSWYVSPMISYNAINFEDNPKTGEAKVDVFNASLLGGYNWVLNSGINIRLGLGAAYNSIDGRVTVSGATYDIGSFSGILPTGELSLGFAF